MPEYYEREDLQPRPPKSGKSLPLWKMEASGCRLRIPARKAWGRILIFMLCSCVTGQWILTGCSLYDSLKKYIANRNLRFWFFDVFHMTKLLLLHIPTLSEYIQILSVHPALWLSEIWRQRLEPSTMQSAAKLARNSIEQKCGRCIENEYWNRHKRLSNIRTRD